MTTRRRRAAGDVQVDLFSVDPTANTMHALDGADWPRQEAFPFNRAGAQVRSPVRADLVSSSDPLIVAGYSSIAELVDFLSDWEARSHEGSVRLLVGTEPFPTTRFSFASARVAFAEEVRRYWEDQGISLRLSAKVLQAIEAVDARRLRARFIHGATTLHAKVYVGSEAATVGSSNFTAAGLAQQLEANARFEKAAEPDRYDGLVRIAENLWAQGQPWDVELRELLELLLRQVPWQEALGRACAVLLEGEWATRYLDATAGVGAALWPSQRAGIAQALWIIETVGSALVADATGSGKTRMGAHLVRAVRDRMWSTGRVRRDVAVVVCPPSVIPTWEHEANVSGVNLKTVSHGLLSRGSAFGRRTEEDAVNQAQILAVDESHNFLNPDARRTQQVRESRADHVLLFTATPINRGPSDLLQLVGFLGADNFEDETIEILKRIDRRRGSDSVLAPTEVELVRSEIQRFTVRRTKALLNSLVDREPEAYQELESGRLCRYPRHDARIYDTSETADDQARADDIRAGTRTLLGVAQLERVVAVPASLRSEYTDERWLAFRLTSIRGLAAYHVLGAMRSSRAALHEHLAGTSAAQAAYGLLHFKASETGDVIGKLDRLASDGPPEVRLECELPDWLTDPAAWRDVCLAERDRYIAMLESARLLSDGRERGKAALLRDLLQRHDRVLAFDHHPITLESLRLQLAGGDLGAEVLVATGATPRERKKVEGLFDRTSSARAVALCSDAMNEGLNLQGASAIVHLDLPTTLRVAEQRIGRVDRMDSPHDSIEAWWPRDGTSFATRANELLAQRAAESEQLLGANLHVPNLTGREEEIVDVERRIREAEGPEAETWDGIRDALEPVRALVHGSDALVPPSVYEDARGTGDRRVVSAVASTDPWAFLAINAGSGQGAPRWLFLDGAGLRPVIGLDDIAAQLRLRLASDPESVSIDVAAEWLDRALDAAVTAERLLLPRRMQRALDQQDRTCRRYARGSQQRGDGADAARWNAIAALAGHADGGARPDPYAVAERWLEVVRPHLDGARARRRHQRFVLLRDIEKDLADNPLDIAVVEAVFAELVAMAPLDERVAACILGVPVGTAPGAAL